MLDGAKEGEEAGDGAIKVEDEGAEVVGAVVAKEADNEVGEAEAGR